MTPARTVVGYVTAMEHGYATIETVAGHVVRPYPGGRAGDIVWVWATRAHLALKFYKEEGQVRAIFGRLFGPQAAERVQYVAPL